MDQLDQAQVQAIRKLSTSRLISKLSKVGYSEEELESMDRDAMLEKWATCVASGRDKPVATNPTVTGYDVAFEREKLAFEQRKFDAMFDLEKKKQATIEAQYALDKEKQKQERAQKESIVSLAKQYGDAMKASVKPMGPEMLDVVQFFRHIEAIFRRFEVPTSLQAALIQPYLNEKSRSVVSRMDPDLCNNYNSVRDVILKEHKLSSCAYLELFNKLTRVQGETTVMYCARLKSLLSMYVESRKVSTFDDMMSLIVCDRIKSTLSENCLRHVLSVEASSKTGWLQAQELAECVDLYKANHFGDSDRPRASAIGSSSTASTVSRGGQAGHGNAGKGGGGWSTQLTESQHAATTPGHSLASKPASAKIICYKCKASGHTRKFCPQNGQSAERRVNRCKADSAVQCDVINDGVNSDAVKSFNECMNVTDEENVCLSHDSDNFVVCDDVNYVSDYSSYRDFVSLQYVNVQIDELSVGKESDEMTCIKAIEDSGSEICVVKASVVESVSLPKMGRVKLRGIVGAPVEADLVKLHVSLVNDSTDSCSASVPVICAVCSDLNENLILTPVLVKQLRVLTGDSVCTARCVNVCDTEISPDSVDANDERELTVDAGDVETAGRPTINESVSLEYQSKPTVQFFVREQQDDESLKSCWVKAKQGSGGFEIRNNLLYHVEYVDCVGERCVQLCLPESRRKAVLELAHCTLGCHQASRRTRDRIRLSFFWPTISKDVRKFCDSCEACQKASRITVWDRTPITAIPRAQYAFQEFFVDCAGPLFPNQKTSAYNYFIVLCDSATSFPFVYPLRALTAKNIAEALIKTWSLTGVPETIIWDNASPHKSELMRELLKRMGCVPRFSTPWSWISIF